MESIGTVETSATGGSASFKQAVSNRTYHIAIFVLLIGTLASGAFLYLGIGNSKALSKDQFDRQSTELVQELESAWHDYETAGLWVHEACRSRDVSRSQFRILYEHLIADGLDFQAAEFIPNVTKEERQEHEDESRQFYQENYPDIGTVYQGIRGLELVNGTSSLQSRSEQPFYFPVYYVEPVVPNAAAIDFDLFSSSSRRSSIESALATWKPTLTRRLRLVQETDPSAYSVLLMHPGIPLEGETPRDLSLMVIRIPSLLARAVQEIKSENLIVQVFDKTGDHEYQFLGGAKLLNSAVEEQETVSVQEVNYTDVAAKFSGNGRHFFEATIQIASAEWTVIIVPNGDAYEPTLGFIILGGAVLFIAGFAAAFWMILNAHRTVRMQQAIQKGEAEKTILSSLFPSNIRDRLIDEAAVKPSLIQDSAGGDQRSIQVYGSKPIADFFPAVTVLFADMVSYSPAC